MSFLLNRAASTFGSNNNQYSSPAGGASSSAVLYDADEEEDGVNSNRRRNDIDDDDDELEAAFGDSHRPVSRHVRDGTGDGSMRGDGEQEDDEAQQLLGNTSHPETSIGPTASGSGSGQYNAGSGTPRPQYSRNNTNTTLGHQSTLSTGGYDFEADPYDRRSTVVPDASSSNGPSPRRSSSGRRRRQSGSRSANGASSAGTGFLAMLRSNIPLPARIRQYGLLNNNANASSGRRRADGNADADDDGDDDSEDDDNWIMPPQSSMPGVFGGGTKNDGVFSNMTAKPGVGRGAREGHEIMGGDDEAPEKEIPPAYEMAVLDAAPPYFDTTVHTTGSGLGGATGGLEEILIEGLPLGNIFSFFWSLLVSMSFQFVGFLLTTLLSTSHAAKNGSRAGLGITLIQYGLYLGQEIDQNNSFSGGSLDAGGQGKEDWAAFWGNGQTTPDTASMSPTSTAPSRTMPTGVSLGLMGNSSEYNGPNLLDGGTAVSGLTSSWMSMVLMIGGWFLLVSSVVAYLKVIRYAKALRDGISNDPASVLERGGLPALIARFTGRDLLAPPRERVWGLPSRPAPREQPPPPLPSFSTRPPPSSSTSAQTPGTASTAMDTPGTAGIPPMRW